MQTNANQANKLSAIMKIGASGLSQRKGFYFKVESGEITKCCSLGAVYIGQFGLEATKQLAAELNYATNCFDGPFMEKIQTEFPHLNKIDGAHELCVEANEYIAIGLDKPKLTLGSAIAQLNDRGCKILKIADALETIGL